MSSDICTKCGFLGAAPSPGLKLGVCVNYMYDFKYTLLIIGLDKIEKYTVVDPSKVYFIVKNGAYI